MEAETDKLRDDLQRYRYLLGRMTDRRFCEVLKELIDETDARLAVAESGDRLDRIVSEDLPSGVASGLELI
jgi:hypothetical protein